MDAISTIEHKGFTISIHIDPDPNNPRDDSNVGRIATVRLSRYSLRDKDEDYLPGDLGGWDEVADYLRNESDAVVVLPMYLYDHSVHSVSVKSFIGRAHHADWDSGQVGFIYATDADIRKEYGLGSKAKITKAMRDRVETILRGEVEAFDRYIRGESYGYIVEKDGEETGSCWGYDDEESAILAAKADIGFEDELAKKKKAR